GHDRPGLGRLGRGDRVPACLRAPRACDPRRAHRCVRPRRRRAASGGDCRRGPHPSGRSGAAGTAAARASAARGAARESRHRSAGSSLDRPIELEADVIVVGSGAGGGVMAAELARAGRAVLVIEAGPFVDEASMPRDELDAYGRLYLNYGLLSTWDGAITMLA